MKKIKLQDDQMKNKNEAHAYLKKILDFPDYYGENLDALHDCLGEICEPILITIPACISDTDHLGDYGGTMLHVFKETASENSYLQVVIE